MSGKQKTVETSQSTNQTQTMDTGPWAAQAGYLKDLFGRAQDVSKSGTGQYYPGQLVADRPADTLASDAYIRNLVGSQLPQMNQQMQGAIDWNLGAGRDMANNPYLQSAIRAAQQPVVQAFSSVGGPLAQIRGQFTGASSGGSGTREGIAEGVAMRGLGQTLANQSALMTNQAYQAAEDRAMQSLGMLPGAMQATAYPAQLLAASGAGQQQYGQQVIDSERDRFMYNQQLPWLNLNNYANLIRGNYGSSGTVNTLGTSTARQPGGSSGGFAGALGGAASLGGLAGMAGLSNPWVLGAMGVGGLLGAFG